VQCHIFEQLAGELYACILRLTDANIDGYGRTDPDIDRHVPDCNVDRDARDGNSDSDTNIDWDTVTDPYRVGNSDGNGNGNL